MVLRVLSVISAALLVGVACGAPTRPPTLFDEVPDASSPADTGATPTLNTDAATAPPGCGVGPDGGVCECVDAPLLLTDVPNLYFVLDRSGSMTELGKWDTIRAVMGQTVSALGPRINVGGATFPNPATVDPTTDQCAVGIQVMAVRPGNPFGVYGMTSKLLVAGFDVAAAGGTPTAATLNSLLPGLKALSGRTYVILATDGGPNCNPTLSCDVGECIPNIEGDLDCVPGQQPNCCLGYPEDCLDATATVDAVSAYFQANIPVYVVGVPGSGPYADLLDQMAQAGGTAQSSPPYYYAVDTADQGAFTQALSSIAAKVTATCTFTLSMAPADPSLINVYLDEQVVPEDPVNGWSISGATVTLLGTTCQRVLSGEVLDVRIIGGCPTVLK